MSADPDKYIKLWDEKKVNGSLHERADHPHRRRGLQQRRRAQIVRLKIPNRLGSNVNEDAIDDAVTAADYDLVPEWWFAAKSGTDGSFFAYLWAAACDLS